MNPTKVYEFSDDESGKLAARDRCLFSPAMTVRSAQDARASGFQARSAKGRTRYEAAVARSATYVCGGWSPAEMSFGCRRCSGTRTLRSRRRPTRISRPRRGSRTTSDSRLLPVGTTRLYEFRRAENGKMLGKTAVGENGRGKRCVSNRAPCARVGGSARTDTWRRSRPPNTCCGAPDEKVEQGCGTHENAARDTAEHANIRRKPSL